MSHKYLEYIREINKIKASKCNICGKRSIGINADGYKVIFVCKEHYKENNDISQAPIS